MYLGTSLFLLKGLASKDLGQAVQEAGTTRNEAGHPRIGIQSVSDTQTVSQTSADEWGRQVEEEKGRNGLGVSRDWLGSKGGC